ncbi:PTS sugar transporter subunit IIA [Sporolactobacillus terrae]|uniref:PTS N-acetylglucosamine transporter subunit IIBC n=1 Tax=Sporolactobacillus terrae TaxID=269673 RepID=A0ABX5Q9N2_9BACL|nr:PTS sugar transporter subunit IIA [Sporolactobacillus terrae]QAA23371.1 PTS N-acetylglucosamine transporter subunit IIBC [Sporolactobacillus terrae]QAA26342.1 PTS N-acetylglucosamine transporter subunit IIBC [Sporolactobacillus terrae]UAK15432.1 PTS sugar transporter subunit IIA [Sporolactobacillus terrae]
MRKIIIASHHKMATGIKDTLNYITGERNNVSALSAYLTNTPIQEEIDALLKGVDQEDEVVVFTDLLGGSVNQSFAKYTARPHFHVIIGINLPIVLTIALKPDDTYLTAEQIRSSLDEAKEQLIYVNDFITNRPEDEDDE